MLCKLNRTIYSDDEEGQVGDENIELEMDKEDFFENNDKPTRKKQNGDKIDSQAVSTMKTKTVDSKASFYFDFEAWNSLNLLKPLMKAVNDMCYSKPTRIQELCIPAIISGKDVLGKSVTGSGKTAAFLLPIMNDLVKTRNLSSFIKVLIVLPTRELALQCFEMLKQLNVYSKLSACLTIGKVPIAEQEAELRKGPEIVIGTPGRIVDLNKNSRGVSFEDVEWLVFDEADKLMEMGFKPEIEAILDMTQNDRRQTLLFSATLGKELQKIVKLALKNPLRVEAEPEQTITHNLTQEVVKLKTVKSVIIREAVLIYLLLEVTKEQTIVFFKTKKQCHRVKLVLDVLGYEGIELHGSLTQAQRIAAVEEFDKKRCFLLATDLAARGLDFKGLKYVINFELPAEESRYVHRVGRTARAGQSGVCISLLDDDEIQSYKKMIKKFGTKISTRQIDFVKVKQLKFQIAKAGNKIKKILEREYLDKQFDKAEMEAKKAQNMLDFAEEIFNKPKREWIVTNKEKKELAQQCKRLKSN